MGLAEALDRKPQGVVLARGREQEQRPAAYGPAPRPTPSLETRDLSRPGRSQHVDEAHRSGHLPQPLTTHSGTNLPRLDAAALEHRHGPRAILWADLHSRV